MNETQVTVVGNVVTAITKRRLDDGTVVAHFRVGNNERRYDRATESWVSGDRLYVQVTCWRRLAENTVASLVMGDPVVVTGRLYTRNYEHEGQRRSVVTLEASTVAADLSRCTAAITRSRPSTVSGSAATDGRADGRVAEEGVSTAPEARADVDRGAAGFAARLVGAVPGGEA